MADIAAKPFQALNHQRQFACLQTSATDEFLQARVEIRGDLGSDFLTSGSLAGLHELQISVVHSAAVALTVAELNVPTRTGYGALLLPHESSGNCGSQDA